MKDAAWKYAHRSQIIVDGTFGISSSKLLLFIVMGIDEEKRGVPLAFLLFSARADAKQSSSSYDSALLKRLLQMWTREMGSRKGEVFVV